MNIRKMLYTPIDNTIKFKLKSDINNGMIYTLDPKTLMVYWNNNDGIQSTQYNQNDTIQQFFDDGTWIKL